MCGSTTALLQAAVLAPEDNQGTEEFEEMQKRLEASFGDSTNFGDSMVVGSLTVPWWFVEWNRETEVSKEEELEDTRQSVRQMFKTALAVVAVFDALRYVSGS